VRLLVGCRVEVWFSALGSDIYLLRKAWHACIGDPLHYDMRFRIGSWALARSLLLLCYVWQALIQASTFHRHTNIDFQRSTESRRSKSSWVCYCPSLSLLVPYPLVSYCSACVSYQIVASNPVLSDASTCQQQEWHYAAQRAPTTRSCRDATEWYPSWGSRSLLRR